MERDSDGLLKSQGPALILPNVLSDAGFAFLGESDQGRQAYFILTIPALQQLMKFVLEMADPGFT